MSNRADSDEESIQSERKLLEEDARQELKNYIKILKEARQKLEREEK